MLKVAGFAVQNTLSRVCCFVTGRAVFLVYWKCHGPLEMVDSRDVELLVSRMSCDPHLLITTGIVQD